MYLTRLEDRLAWGREQGGIYTYVSVEVCLCVYVGREL